jgi:hypothetical protein
MPCRCRTYSGKQKLTIYQYLWPFHRIASILQRHLHEILYGNHTEELSPIPVPFRQLQQPAGAKLQVVRLLVVRINASERARSVLMSSSMGGKMKRETLMVQAEDKASELGNRAEGALNQAKDGVKKGVEEAKKKVS